MQEAPTEISSPTPPASFYEVLVRATPRFWVTPLLVGANLAWFAWAILQGVSPLTPDPLQLIEIGASFGPRTLGGEWWRVLSSTFVHVGFLHLGFNMWCLWSLGNVAERMFGNLAFLVLYLLSGVGGSLASLLWHPEIISAGASGAVFGIAGGLVAFLYFGKILAPPQVVRSLLGSLVFIVVLNLLFGALWQGIDNAGHIGGLAVGLVLGVALHRPLPSGRRGVAGFLVVPLVSLVLAVLAQVAMDRSIDNPEFLAAAARDLAAAGESEAAVAKLEEAVALSPRSASVRATLGTLYLELERYDDAVETLRNAVDLDPQLYEPQKSLAIALALSGKKEQAAEEFRIARRMKPSDLSMYVVSSQILMEAGRLDEAVEVLEEARTWAPESAPIESAMGLAHLRRDELRPALESLNKAARLEPDNAEHHNRLALTQARAGEEEASLVSIRKALELLPDAPHLLDSLGTVHFYRGELARAVEAYERAIARDPEQAVYHYNLSLALEKQGKQGEAQREREEALRLDSELAIPEDGHPIL